jgi:ribosome-binding factor A
MVVNRRLQRLSGLFQEELSELLLREVRDPRLAGLVSITGVVISSDLRHARVYVSIMGGEEEKVSTLKGLTAAAPFLRRELNSRVSLRRIPELSFWRDDSLEQGARVSDLLKQIADDTDNP